MRFIVDEKHFLRDAADDRAAMLAAMLLDAGKKVMFVLITTPRGVVTIEAREAKA